MTGVIPFMPFEGVVLVVVVAFTDMVTSGGLGGQMGGFVGPNEIDTVSRENVDSGMAGELGL
jgi:hypothetical protein